MIAKTGQNFDVLLITGEYYDDHPLSPTAVIARVIDAKGFNVGIIEKPLNKEQFIKLGSPRLCFCATSGSLDSMLNNYTPLKRKRVEDKYSRVTKIPDRAVIFDCNKLKEYFKSSIIVIGGVEASLRRFAHYDYWDNNIRRSILLDSRANILVYGNGEKQIIEIVERLKHGNELIGIEGTCILSKDLDDSFELLPSFKEVIKDKRKFFLSMFSRRPAPTAEDSGEQPADGFPALTPDPSSSRSFRDPDATLLEHEGRLVRAVRVHALANFRAVLEDPVVRSWMEQGRLVRTTPLARNEWPPQLAAFEGECFLHERIPFVGQPCEWAPEMLAAAGALLELARALLPRGLQLKDATPANVLFRNSEPVFVDLPSIVVREPGSCLWIARHQFETTFLLPLIASVESGLPIAWTL